MIVYRCDRCEEEVDEPVIVRRKVTRPSGQYHHEEMEYCERCAKVLPLTNSFRVAIYDKRDGGWSHNESWSETIYAGDDKDGIGNPGTIVEPEDTAVNRHVYV